jgi:hypothetical protein
MALSFSQRAFNLTKHSGDRAAFLFQEPQAVPQTDYSSLACCVHGGPNCILLRLDQNVNKNTSRAEPALLNCCSLSDSETVADPDWESKDGHYRVRLDGKWIDVPDDAVITEPNLVGRTMVWPMPMIEGDTIKIRCFMPGSMI